MNSLSSKLVDDVLFFVVCHFFFRVLYQNLMSYHSSGIVSFYLIRYVVCCMTARVECYFYFFFLLLVVVLHAFVEIRL